MVWTRGIKYKFIIGERVLCYEPDPTKAVVLYDSKVMEIIETKDKNGKKIIEYLIHFQGWNSSWDRRVNEDFVLKDIDENRQLQKRLAEKSQLQIGAFLYRKEQKKRKHSITSKSSTDSPKILVRGSSEENNSSSSTATTATTTTTVIRDAVRRRRGRRPRLVSNMENQSRRESESCSSSAAEGTVEEEERITLKVGDRLRSYLDNDYDMINTYNKQLILPAKVTAITILENFVRHHSLKSICPSSSEQTAVQSKRRSSTKVDKRELDYDKIKTSINLRREVADGLRIYFNFTLTSHLLYEQEQDQSIECLSDEYLNNFKYIPFEPPTLDKLLIKHDSTHEYNELQQTLQSSTAYTNASTPATVTTDSSNNSTRRRLRSAYKPDGNELICELDLNAVKTPDDEQRDLSIISSTTTASSGSANAGGISKSTTPNSSNLNVLKDIFPLNITTKSKEILQNILQWQILPNDAKSEASMIYGGIHLARLIVKLPDFLNATSIPDNKMIVLLQFLDSFADYLESHSEWFGEDQYEDAVQNSINNNNNNNNNTIQTDDDDSIKTVSVSPPSLKDSNGKMLTIKCEKDG